ncbi:MAG: hypothetical protein Q9212_001940 [Teloschistes hypoglaucus]
MNYPFQSLGRRRNGGNNSLGLEGNLYPSDNATFGLDTVALGVTNATGGPTMRNQIVAAISGNEYVMGMFGLGQQPTNLSDFSNPHPSFLTMLYSQRLIPSLTWSYTAGAKYRRKGVFGSLTFGGIDAARFFPNDVTFDLSSDISRDLVVGLQSIKSIESNGSTNWLLPSAHLTFIDSTISYIYLPKDACTMFERVFDLSWNSTYGMYLVDDALHRSLLTRNPTFTFTIANSLTEGPTVDILLPYSSFDLGYLPFFDTPTLRYFPIQPADNDTQLTLGRAFLQEAYVTTDYQRGNFSVSQCKFEESLEQRIVPIVPSGSGTSTTSPQSHPTGIPNAKHPDSHLTHRQLAGIISGAISGALLLLAILYWLYRRWGFKRQNRTITASVASTGAAAQVSEPLQFFENPPELEPVPGVPEMAADHLTRELSGSATLDPQLDADIILETTVVDRYAATRLEEVRKTILNQ